MIKVLMNRMHKAYQVEFDRKRKADNYKKLMILGIAMFVIQIFALIQNILEPFTDNPVVINRYYGFYVVMIIVNLMLLITMFVFNKKDLYTSKYFTLVMILHIATINIWGMGVAIADQFQGQDVVVYYLTMIFLAILINVSALELGGLLIIIYLIFAVISPFYSNYIVSQVQVLLTSAQFIMFSVIIRYYLERLTSRNFIQHKKLIEVNDKLERLSYFDSLSGLYNRRKWEETYVEMYKHCYETKSNLTVILFDIDYFKKYNDYYGHVKGDSIIKVFSEVLLESVASLECNTGRYGGDEFIMSIEGVSENQVFKLIKEIKNKMIDKKIENIESKLNGLVTISAGSYYGVPENVNEVWDCVVKADNNLYLQKDNR